MLSVCRRTQFQGKKVNGNISSHPITGSEMTDLATLRELPRRESFVQQNNAIYGVGDGDIDQELALLPHIRFEDLLITKFLGRGAFGEVFEGTTCNLPGSNQYHTKVAVKVCKFMNTQIPRYLWWFKFPAQTLDSSQGGNWPRKRRIPQRSDTYEPIQA